MKKSVITTLLSTMLILSTNVTAFAQDSNWNERTIVPYTQENVDLYENLPTSLAPDEIIVSENEDSVEPYGVAIEAGTYRTAYSARQSNGVIYQDATKSASVLNTIKDVALTISGYYTSTVFNVIKDAASLVYGYLPSEIAVTKPGSATWDYVAEDGYSPIKTDYAKYYNDDATIRNIALEVWTYNRNVVRYGWSF